MSEFSRINIFNSSQISEIVLVPQEVVMFQTHVQPLTEFSQFFQKICSACLMFIGSWIFFITENKPQQRVAEL